MKSGNCYVNIDLRGQQNGEYHDQTTFEGLKNISCLKTLI